MSIKIQWHITGVGRLRQEDHKFKANLGYLKIKVRCYPIINELNKDGKGFPRQESSVDPKAGTESPK